VTPALRRSGDQPLLHLVMPRWQGTGIHMAFGHRMPPMALLVLSALAKRCGWRTRIIDENFETLPDERPDLAMLAVWTAIAPASYRLADAYRARNIPTVLGGVHASLLPNEGLRHADSVVCGEAEGILATVLADAAAGRLQALYQGSWQGMDVVPPMWEWADTLGRWPITRYAPLNTLQTTRGCRFNCDFCSVIRINGRGSRHRDPRHVVEELRFLKKTGQHVGGFSYVFFLDDDLAADLDYTRELCEALIASNVKMTWGAQASIGLARDTELIDLAVRAGCRVIFTGFESVSRAALVECNKKNRPNEYGHLIANLHQRGVAVEGGFIFGFDHDEADVFDETVDFVDNICVDVAHFSVLTPYPGTHTYARMLAAGRITSFDWKRYNMYHTVYSPERMTAEQLDAGLRSAYRNFYGRSRRARRFLRDVRGRDPRFHMALSAANVNYATRYRRPGLTPEPGYVAHPEDVAGLAETSRVPAQEALNVAFSNARASRPLIPAAPNSP